MDSSSKRQLQVVWFKRDLRVDDHLPLARAAAAGPTLPLFVYEPELWSSPDMSAGHHWWVTQSLRELRNQLAKRGQPLIVRSGNILSVLNDIRERFGAFILWSHEETGNGVTYARDRAVLKWCRAHSIPWNECRQFGVIRRLRDRDRWAQQWEDFMAQPITECPRQIPSVQLDIGSIPDNPLPFQPSSLHQLPGEAAAAVCLRSFLLRRGQGYSGGISSPSSAAHCGSRLSPYLAWGNISMRRVIVETRKRQAELRAMPPTERGSWLHSLNAFDARLHWHCHFIQKLESEPEVEHECFVRALNDMRDANGNEHYLHAWCNGLTGYPFVDACMRSLRATGWLNFRMRAMLVSFAAYDLFLDWRLFAAFLAQQFLDYEPGIHYPQVQMQSGTTGINTIRIYDPVKQGYDHDPDGTFIRTWVPELALIPGRAVHEPWKLSPLEQRECKFLPGATYPARIVEHIEAIRRAREIVYRFRNELRTAGVLQETLRKHGSRAVTNRRSRAARRTAHAPRAKSNQIPLFS